MDELGSIWFYQESMDDLRQKLQYSAFELEALKAKSIEDKKLHEEEVKNLIHLLTLARQERDEAKDQLQKFLIKKHNIIDPNNNNNNNNNNNLLLPPKANSSITESNSQSHVSSPVSSPEFSNFTNASDPVYPFVNQPVNRIGNSQRLNLKIDPVETLIDEMIKGKSLPTKGKLLQTVMESGPLLQTLLVAGPLPRWRNPPPLQQSFRVPQISNSYDLLKVCSTSPKFSLSATNSSMLKFRGCSVPGIATGIQLPKRQRFH